MKNFLEKGLVMQIIATAAITGGTVQKVGDIIGVAVTDAKVDEPVAIDIVGVFTDLPKSAGAAFGVGDKLYWDATAGNFTKIASGNTLAGHAWLAANASSTTCVVRLSN